VTAYPDRVFKGKARVAVRRPSAPDRRPLVLALNLLADSYDTQRLDDPRQMETALREMIDLTPNDLTPVYRLGKFQEDHGFIDAAEETLLGARHQQPDAVEPYAMLAEFYSRRALALRRETDPQLASQVGTPPGALAAGVQGVVIAEIVINESGNVTDARILRSIPLLDGAALEAVRQWQFSPTVVNGATVPVKMTVTVNFTPPLR
jgi:TonB family protein